MHACFVCRQGDVMALRAVGVTIIPVRVVLGTCAASAKRHRDPWALCQDRRPTLSFFPCAYTTTSVSFRALPFTDVGYCTSTGILATSTRCKTEALPR